MLNLILYPALNITIISLFFIIIVKNFSVIFKQNWTYSLIITLIAMVMITKTPAFHTLIPIINKKSYCYSLAQTYKLLFGKETIPWHFNHLYQWGIFTWLALELLLLFSIYGFLVYILQQIIFVLKYYLNAIFLLIKSQFSPSTSNLNNINDDVPITNSKNDLLGFNELTKEFYTQYIASNLNKSQNTVIILDSIFRIGKTSFLNLLHEKIEESNIKIFAKPHHIHTVKFSAMTVLAQCEDNKNTIIATFINFLYQQLQDTGVDKFLRHISNSYTEKLTNTNMEKFNKEHQTLEGISKKIQDKHQTIVLIIEDLDRLTTIQLFYILTFLYHIKECPRIITILPAEVQKIYSALENHNTQDNDENKGDRNNDDSDTPHAIHEYHKLIDDTYDLTARVRNRQVELLWGEDNKCYKKESDEIIIAKKEIKNAKEIKDHFLYIDDQKIFFNNQEININNLPIDDREKVKKLQNENTVKYQALLFLPLKMLNFWQNTTIFPSKNHAQLFHPALLQIITKFNVTTSEIKKTIQLFQDDKRYQKIKNIHIVDIFIYSIIKTRYAPRIHLLGLDNNFMTTLFKTICMRTTMEITESINPHKLNTNLPQEFMQLLRNTTWQGDIFFDTKYSFSTMLFINPSMDFLHPFNNHGLYNCSNNENIIYDPDDFQLTKLPLRSYVQWLFYTWYASNKSPTPETNRIPFWRFILFYNWLLLDANSTNLLYKLTILQFFKNQDFKTSWSDAHYSAFFTASGINFLMILIVAHGVLQRDDIYYKNIIANIIVKMVHHDNPSFFNYVNSLAHTQLLFVYEKGKRFSSTDITWDENEKKWIPDVSLIKTKIGIQIKYNTFFEDANLEYIPYDNLEITLGKFVNNLNDIEKLAKNNG